MFTKKKLFKGVTTLAFAATLFSATAMSSSAAEGGWTEGEGNWSSNTYSSKFGPSLSEQYPGGGGSTSPESHYATFNYKNYSSYQAKQVVAHTSWSGVYHYSRARFESSLFGVSGDSGRKWGTGSTVAYSSFVDPAGSIAKTYWGN